MIIEIKESKVNVHVIRGPSMGGSNMTPVIGQAWVRSSQKGNNGMRLVNMMTDGSVACFICRQVGSEESKESSEQTAIERLEASIKNSIGNVDNLIHKSDLPQDAQLSISYFEKHKSLIFDSNLRQKLTFFGDLIQPFKTSKAFVEILQKAIGQQSAILQDGSKKSIKFQLKLEESADHVVTGFRFRMNMS